MEADLGRGRPPMSRVGAVHFEGDLSSTFRVLPRTNDRSPAEMPGLGREGGVQN